MDRLTPEQRSRLMARIRGRDTRPELAVRRIVHSLGRRFRLHGRYNGTTLWGRPDLVLPGLSTVIFVHGCFWHMHACGRCRMPKSNCAFWRAKLLGNAARDRRHARLLRQHGWRVIVVWECHLRRPESVRRRLERLIGRGA